MALPLATRQTRPRTHAELRQLVEQRLRSLSLPLQVPHLVEPIRHTLDSGGKRVRPVLLLMAYNLFQEEITPCATDVAVAVEVMHNFTLMHDDVLDRAELRRGRPTVNARWSPQVAILSGDAMSILALHLALSCPSSLVRRVLDVLCRTALEVCEGEQMDMDFEDQDQVTSAQYLEMVERKTGALLRTACSLGGLLAHAEPADQQRLADFGRHLGTAFQIHDDALDVFGDQEAFGKRIGGDILADKKSYPLLRARELTRGAEHRELLRQLASRPTTAAGERAKIQAVQRILHGCGAEEHTRESAHQHLQSALRALDDVAVTEDRKSALHSLVESLQHRAV